jgi:hypothetical protein
MNSLISAELLKARTTRALWIAVPIVLALSAIIPVVNGALAGTGDVPALTPHTLLDVVRGPVQLAGAATLLLGLLSSAGEFRHRTVFLSRLAEPRSSRLFLAKLAAIVLQGVGLGLAVDVISLVSGTVVLRVHSVPVHMASGGVPYVLVLVPLVTAVYGVFGVAIGALIRSTAGAVGAVLIWAFVVEGILPVVTGSPHLADRLPSAALKAVLHQHATAGSPSPAVAALLLSTYVGALILAAAVMDKRTEL